MPDTVERLLTVFDADGTKHVVVAKEVVAAEAAIDQAQKNSAESATILGGRQSELAKWARDHAREKRAELGVLRAVSFELGEKLPHAANLGLAGMRLLGTGIGPIGLAVAGATLAWELFSGGTGKAAEEARKNVEKIAEDTRKAAEALRHDLTEILSNFEKTAAQTGLDAGQKLMVGLLERLDKEGSELQKKLDDVNKKIRDAYKDGNRSEGSVLQALFGERHELEEAVTAAGKAGIKALTDAQHDAFVARDTENRKEAEKFNLDTIKAQQEAHRLFLAEEKAYADKRNALFRAANEIGLSEAEKAALRQNDRLNALRKNDAVGREAAERIYADELKAIKAKSEAENLAAADAAVNEEIAQKERENHAFAEVERAKTEEAKRQSAERRQIALEEAKRLYGIIKGELGPAFTEAATINSRYSAAYKAHSLDRRAQDLLEQGVVKTSAEGRRIAGEEAKAAEDQKTAAEKEARSERMVGLGEELAVKSIAEFAGGNVPGGIAYGIGSAAAFALAGEQHSEAVSLTQGRNFTGAENDSLRSGQSALASRSQADRQAAAGGSSGLGQNLGQTVIINLNGMALSTAASVQDAVAQALAAYSQRQGRN